MKKLLALALLLAPLPAVAKSDVICTIRMDNGTEMAYFLEKDGVGDLTEVAVTKNGSTLQHAPGRQPVWELLTHSNGMTLTYVPDRRYRIIVYEAPIAPLGIPFSRAGFMRSDQDVGHGQCAFPNMPRAGRRTSPRPEKF